MTRVLTIDEVQAVRLDATHKYGSVISEQDAYDLCDSHEAIRAERDEWKRKADGLEAQLQGHRAAGRAVAAAMRER